MEIELLKKEFEEMVDNFASMFEVIDDNDLKEMYSTYNLYEIEPFFSQVKNITQEGASFLMDENDYDPNNDDLYLYYIDFERRRTVFKRLMLGTNTSYDTLFSYDINGYKSATVYINENIKKPISLSYLTFRDEIPYIYTEVVEDGVMTKHYKSEGKMLTGYYFDFRHFVPNGMDFKSEAFFEYDFQGELSKIIEVRNSGFKELVFTKFTENHSLDWALKTIENYLITQIKKQIAENVNIEEPIYTILLEYCMQSSFPPAIGIGLESELEKYIGLDKLMSYNAPDMFYFSEKNQGEPGAIKIDLYDLEIQMAYKFVDQMYLKSIEFDTFQKEVFGTYLNIIKKLSDCDFGPSIKKSKNFMVMARDFEECNEEQFYNEMLLFKNDM